jgi:hypothetical protein
MIHERVTPAQILGDDRALAERAKAAPTLHLDGHSLCGEPVSKAEFDEYLKTGIVPARILKPHTHPKVAVWE